MSELLPHQLAHLVARKRTFEDVDLIERSAEVKSIRGDAPAKSNRLRSIFGGFGMD